MMKSDWVETNLEVIAKWGSGGTPKSTVAEYYDGDIPWLIIGDLNDGHVSHSEKKITQKGLENSSARLVKPNSVLLAMYGSIGKLGINTIPLTTNQAIAFTQTIYGNIEVKYVFYYLLSIRPKLHKLGKGGTQKNISQTVIKTVEFPLTSILEQKAIIAKIEQLFSELDNGIENLKTAQAKLKIYRQAVLKKAFESIEQVNFDDLILSFQNGISKRNGTDGQFYKVLRLADVKNFEIKEDEPRTIKLTDPEIEKYKLQKNDLVCTRVNGSKDLVGTFIIYGDDKSWAFCDHFIRLTLNEKKAIPKFYYYFLQTREVRKYIHDNMVSSAGQNTVSQTTLKNIQVPQCSLAIQAKIIQEIESRLSICDKIEETIKQTLLKSEALRQSILKKAFEGNLLNTQELEAIRTHPDYESAEELLKRIKQERAK